MPHTNLLKFIERFLIITLLLCGVSVLAQTEKIAFEKYGVAEGLPEEFVSSIIQDDQGFIWATTQNGLVKFDGYKFKVFRSDSDTTETGRMRMRGGYRVIKTKEGKLWISHYSNGIMSYDPKTERFKNYLPNPDDPSKLPYGDSNMLFEDVHNNIWFLTR